MDSKPRLQPLSKTIACPQCDRLYATMEALTDHTKSMHEEKSCSGLSKRQKKKKTGKFTCEFCQKTFRKRYKLSCHRISLHLPPYYKRGNHRRRVKQYKDEKKTRHSPPIPPAIPEQPLPPQFVCTSCYRIYPSEEAWGMHWCIPLWAMPPITTPLPPLTIEFRCNLCMAVFTTAETYADHLHELSACLSVFRESGRTHVEVPAAYPVEPRGESSDKGEDSDRGENTGGGEDSGEGDDSGGSEGSDGGEDSDKGEDSGGGEDSDGPDGAETDSTTSYADYVYI